MRDEISVRLSLSMTRNTGGGGAAKRFSRQSRESYRFTLPRGAGQKSLNPIKVIIIIFFLMSCQLIFSTLATGFGREIRLEDGRTHAGVSNYRLDEPDGVAYCCI